MLLCSLAAQANWQLDNDASQLNFISTKASHVAETHTFGNLSGEITEQGAAEIFIDLTTVDTGVEIRNERMQSMLFDVATLPQARITADLDLSDVADLNAPKVVTISADLTLVGQTTRIVGDVLVTPAVNNKVNVTTVAPIILNANTLGLVSGVEALRDVVGLPSIGYSVPVTFNLTFKR